MFAIPTEKVYRGKRALTLSLGSALAAGVILLTQAAPVSAEDPALAAMRAHVNKGNYLLSRRSFAEAIKEYEEVLKLDPNNKVAKDNITVAHNHWAIWYFNQKKYGDALAEWQKALALNPNHVEAKRNIALMKQMMAAQGLSIDDLGVTGGDPTPPKEDKDKPTPIAPKIDPATPSGPVIMGSSKPPQNTPEEGPPVFVPGMQAQVARTAPYKTPEQQALQDHTSSIFGNTQIPEPKRAPVNNIQNSSSPLFPVLPEVRPAVSATTSQPTDNNTYTPSTGYTPSSTYTPSTPYTPSTSTTSSTSSTIEESLSAVEMKIYGSRQADLTVLQRLEKLERDTAGQTRSGTIIERVNSLKQNFGL